MNNERGVFPYTTQFSRVDVLVSPVNPRVFQAILAKGTELHPLPNKDDFMKPYEGDEDGEKLPVAMGDTHYFDDSDPKYIKERLSAEAQQKDYLLKTLFATRVEYLPSQSHLITQFADELKTIREIGSGVSDDEWRATLWYCILDKIDESRIYKLLTDRLPITGEELQGSLRMFQTDLQK